VDKYEFTKSNEFSDLSGKGTGIGQRTPGIKIWAMAPQPPSYNSIKLPERKWTNVRHLKKGCEPGDRGLGLRGELLVGDPEDAALAALAGRCLALGEIGFPPPGHVVQDAPCGVDRITTAANDWLKKHC